jgi:hypothetical protein
MVKFFYKLIEDNGINSLENILSGKNNKEKSNYSHKINKVKNKRKNVNLTSIIGFIKI